MNASSIASTATASLLRKLAQHYDTAGPSFDARARELRATADDVEASQPAAKPTAEVEALARSWGLRLPSDPWTRGEWHTWTKSVMSLGAERTAAGDVTASATANALLEFARASMPPVDLQLVDGAP